jgi:hypothetical protein
MGMLTCLLREALGACEAGIDPDGVLRVAQLTSSALL